MKTLVRELVFNSQEPGDQLVNSHEPGDQLVNSHEPGDQLVNTHEPGDQLVNTHEPGDQLWFLFKKKSVEYHSSLISMCCTLHFFCFPS